MDSVRLTSDLTTPRILVADPDHAERDALCAVLRERGFDVLEASDADEALRQATSFPLDLAVVDLDLEPMRGDELARWLAELNPDIAVVCTSAFATFDAAVAAVRCGAMDFLEKPFAEPGEVVEGLLRAIERRRFQQQQRGREVAPPQEEEASEADLKRRFLSAVAHELRTPLTVIKTFVTVLRRGVHGHINEDQAEILGNVEIEADRLSHEVDKLLSLARLESEDFAPNREPAEIQQILRPIQTRLQARARELGIDLLFKVGDANAQVLADAQDISHVLLALTENALKFTGEGGRVVVYVGTEGNEVRFDVLDTGIGIDAAHHEEIFEMFVQLENPLTRRHRGSGLGLPYAQRIIAAHGSRIEVRSRLGDGASFAFSLPIARDDDAPTLAILGLETGSVGHD